MNSTVAQCYCDSYCTAELLTLQHETTNVNFHHFSRIPGVEHNHIRFHFAKAVKQGN